MKNSEFDLGRKKYINLLNRKKKYLKKKQRLYELLKEPLIKEYLEIALLLSGHSDCEFDEDLLGIKAFDKLAKKTECSNGIYMYVGKDEKTNKILLQNVENLKKFKTSVDGFEVLKHYKHIIYIENKNNDPDFYDKMFLEIRKEYLSSLKDLDQETAKEMILKKNND